MAKKNDRFLVTYSQGNAFGTHQQVWVDKQTGVNYLFVARGGRIPAPLQSLKN